MDDEKSWVRILGQNPGSELAMMDGSQRSYVKMDGSKEKIIYGILYFYTKMNSSLLHSTAWNPST